MGMIYSSGKRNLIYLGEDDSGMASRAENCIQNIVDEMRTATDEFEILEATLIDLETGDWRYSSGVLETDIDWEALTAHYNLSWFR